MITSLWDWNTYQQCLKLKMLSTYNIALVIPCFNEEKRLNTDIFIEELSKHSNLTLLFVNDGSKDNTPRVIQKICRSNRERALYLSLDKNKGKGEAVRRGLLYLLEYGLYDIIGFWDADLAVSLSEVWDFVDVFRQNPGVHCVIGSRVHLAGRVIERVHSRHYLGRLFATIVSLTFNLNIYDTQCGAKIFDSKLLSTAIQEPFCSKWIFDVELIIRISRLAEIQDKDRWLYEVPVRKWFNVSGTKRSIDAYVIAFFDYLYLINRYFH